MQYKEITSENRQEVNRFIQEHWFSTQMVIRGKIVDMTTVDGFIAYEKAEITGLITYLISDGTCEITSLDSLRENRGIGTKLIEHVISAAKDAGCTQIRLITTNDNINAMRFYQKRGFDMARIYRNAIEASRKLKPSIPLLGDFGIPIRHEIEFVYSLSE